MENVLQLNADKMEVLIIAPDNSATMTRHNIRPLFSAYLSATFLCYPWCSTHMLSSRSDLAFFHISHFKFRARGA